MLDVRGASACFELNWGPTDGESSRAGVAGVVAGKVLVDRSQLREK